MAVEPLPFSSFVDWYGPYKSRSEAARAAGGRLQIIEGLYLVIGYKKLFPFTNLNIRGLFSEKRLRYVGKSNKGLAKRIEIRDPAWKHWPLFKSWFAQGFRDHSKLARVSEQHIEVWIGTFGQDMPGDRLEVNLDQVEWLFIYALRPNLNKQKKKNPPKVHVKVHNNWHTVDGVRWSARKIPGGRFLPDEIHYQKHQSVIILEWYDEKGKVKQKRVPVGGHWMFRFLRRRFPQPCTSVSRFPSLLKHAFGRLFRNA